MSSINVRNAVIEDAERLLEIYSYYVERTAITFEYCVPTLAEFQERMAFVGIWGFQSWHIVCFLILILMQ